MLMEGCKKGRRVKSREGEKSKEGMKEKGREGREGRKEGREEGKRKNQGLEVPYLFSLLVTNLEGYGTPLRLKITCPINSQAYWRSNKERNMEALYSFP